MPSVPRHSQVGSRPTVSGTQTRLPKSEQLCSLCPHKEPFSDGTTHWHETRSRETRPRVSALSRRSPVGLVIPDRFLRDAWPDELQRGLQVKCRDVPGLNVFLQRDQRGLLTHGHHLSVGKRATFTYVRTPLRFRRDSLSPQPKRVPEHRLEVELPSLVFLFVCPNEDAFVACLASFVSELCACCQMEPFACGLAACF